MGWEQGIGPWTSHQAFLALCRANNLGTGEHDVRPTQDPIMSVMFVNSHEAVSSVCQEPEDCIEAWETLI